MNENELNDLKSNIDSIYIQLSKVTVKQETILSMILGIYFETLPQANAKQIAKNLFDLLEKNQSEALGELSDHLFDSGKILRSKMDLLSEIQHARSTFGLID